MQFIFDILSRHLLEAIWEGPTALDPHLRELRRLEFLYERSGIDEPVHVFKHALTQEVAYAGLLSPRRQGLHAAAGRAIEALYAGRLEQIYDRLAHHYSKTADAAKAAGATPDGLALGGPVSRDLEDDHGHSVLVIRDGRLSTERTQDHGGR